MSINVSSHEPDDNNDLNKKKMTVEQTEEEGRSGLYIGSDF